MATSSLLGGSDGAETPMLDTAVDGAVDYKGRPAWRSNSGGWRSAAFTIGNLKARDGKYNTIFIYT